MGDILAYNEELGSNGIIWHHSDIPEDLWVLGTNVMTNELSNATKVLPISVDPKFNFGRYEVTPFTYRSVNFECKSKNVIKTWVPVTVIGPTTIQHTKFNETYELAMRSIAKKCKLEIADETCIITDGEPALISASSKTFSNSTLLQCMKHFERNCKDILKKIGIQGSAKDSILDVVFGENGLVEADSKKDLKSKMKESVKLLSEIEREFLKQKPSQEYGQFALYIAEREKTVLRKMTKDVRRNAFRVKDMQNSPRIYTNQSEAVN